MTFHSSKCVNYIKFSIYQKKTFLTIYRMENKQGASKKTIKVRKPCMLGVTGSSCSSLHSDKDKPIASNDSQWNGIKFTVPENKNTEHTNGFSDIENEIKVIDLDTEEKPPLLLLFPELKSEEINVRGIINREVSTTDVTRMLVGKKPNMALLKPSKKLNDRKWNLTAVEELSDSDLSSGPRRPSVKITGSRKCSRDADESDCSE